MWRPLRVPRFRFQGTGQIRIDFLPTRTHNFAPPSFNFWRKKNKNHFGLNLAPIVRVRKLINRSWPVVRVNGSALSETDGSPSCPIQSRHSPLNRGGLHQCVDVVAARMWHNPAEILPKFASQWTTFRHLFYSLNHLITELKCQNHHQFVEEMKRNRLMCKSSSPDEKQATNPFVFLFWSVPLGWLA